MQFTTFACNLINVDIANRIKQARENAGLNQSQLAKAVDVRPQSAQQWETGATVPRTKVLRKVAYVLGVSPEWLLFGNEDSATKAEEEKTAYSAHDKTTRQLLSAWSTLPRTAQALFLALIQGYGKAEIAAPIEETTETHNKARRGA